MLDQQQSKQSRNIACTRKHSAKIEQCLTKVEKADGCARAWELREQIERGEISLNELRRR
jgi:hypothetical protein